MMSPVTSSTARRATATARSAPGGEGINRHGTADWGDASSAAANTERPDRYYNYRYGIIIMITGGPGKLCGLRRFARASPVAAEVCRSYWAFEHSGLNFVCLRDRVPATRPFIAIEAPVLWGYRAA